MILGKKRIEKLGSSLCSPYRREHINPASMDVCLGDYLRIYTESLDARAKNPSKQLRINPHGEELVPGFVYLGHTLEEVRIPPGIAAQLIGKSSIGRLGLQIHLTAGYIDPGFQGEITLELAVTQPLVIYPRMRIGQLVFHEVDGQESYQGRYQGDSGPVPSRAWEQLEEYGKGQEIG